MQETEKKTISYSNLVKNQSLQRLQDDFAKISETIIRCFDAAGEPITSVSGGKGVPEVEQLFEQEAVKEALERIAEGSLEEIAIEMTDTGRAVAAVSVRLSGVCAIQFVVIGKENNIKFFQMLDFLRDYTVSLFEANLLREQSELALEESIRQRDEVMYTLETSNATSEIVQLLDRDDNIGAVLGKALEIMVRHLQTSSAQVVKYVPDPGVTTTLAEWCQEGIDSLKDVIAISGSKEMWKTDLPLIVSADSVAESGLEKEFREFGLCAGLLFPVIKEDNGIVTYLTIQERDKERAWSLTEIKFVVDTIKVVQSVLTKRIQKNSLSSSYEALQSVLDHVGASIYVKDAKTGKALFANNRLKYNFAKEIRQGSIDSLMKHGIPVGKNKNTYEIHYSDRERWYDMIRTDISWVDGRDAVLYSLFDITDKKIYQHKIEQQANTDFLTGLYNRMCCERDLALQVEMARIRQKTGALLYMDLDDFKHINDGLGHQYGDELLKSISKHIRAIEGIQQSCYRMGGDEFIIIVSPDAYERFDEILQQIKEVFSKPWYLKDSEYYCGTSIGVVNFPCGEDTVADLIKKADIAMYEAKRGGKNQSRFYENTMASASGRRLDMEKSMRDATQEGYREFEVYYQPIIQLQDGKVNCAGAEALIRWNSSKLGFISPAEFIPLAEYLGLITPIGHYILKEACESCKLWNDNGYPDYKVNVNLSVVQLLQADVVEKIAQVLEETGINPANLTLEVTESLAINDMERMKVILNSIKELGVKIALDDFGTGYSSLNHIREIPFDLIKVDQSFAQGLADDAYAQSFIKLVSELAETIGVYVCVEGIETTEQVDVLHNMKVRYVQGYLYDRPMIRELFEEKYVSGVANLRKNM